MEPKIFKSVLITIAIVMGLHSMAVCQGMTPEQEKNLELKMKQMEQKLQEMQIKLDSMKVHQKTLTTVRINGLNYAQQDMDRALKALSRVTVTPITPMPPMKFAPMAPMSMGQMNKAFKSLDKMNFNMNFNYDASDQKIEEKIKSGELKEVTKAYSKSYTVDKDDKLMIDNRFGKVTVITWNKNEFKVDAQIKADANDQDEAQKLLDGVSITDSKDGPTVFFKTAINSNGNNSWGISSNDGKTTARRVVINYTVYMPAKSSLEIDNRFGGIELPDFDGKLTINSSFGSFTAKKLTNLSNEINSKNGSANIESLNGSQLKISYGSLTLGSGDNLNAEISFSPVKIGKIKTAGTITMRYGGGLQIADLDKNLKSLTINSSYIPVSVGVNNNQNLDFDVTVHNADFNYGDHNVTVTSTSPDDNGRKYSLTKTYKGHLGKGNADKVVTIKANYGSVKFDLQ